MSGIEQRGKQSVWLPHARVRCPFTRCSLLIADLLAGIAAPAGVAAGVATAPVADAAVTATPTADILPGVADGSLVIAVGGVVTCRCAVPGILVAVVIV